MHVVTLLLLTQVRPSRQRLFSLLISCSHLTAYERVLSKVNIESSEVNTPSKTHLRSHIGTYLLCQPSRQIGISSTFAAEKGRRINSLVAFTDSPAAKWGSSEGIAKPAPWTSRSNPATTVAQMRLIGFAIC